MTAVCPTCGQPRPAAKPPSQPPPAAAEIFRRGQTRGQIAALQATGHRVVSDSPHELPDGSLAKGLRDVTTFAGSLADLAAMRLRADTWRVSLVRPQ